MFDGQHFLVAFVLFSGALAWHCPPEPSSEGPPNLDCVKVKHGCGKLVLTNEQGRETVFPGEQDPRRTRPCIGFRDGNGVKSATVEGPLQRTGRRCSQGGTCCWAGSIDKSPNLEKFLKRNYS